MEYQSTYTDWVVSPQLNHSGNTLTVCVTGLSFRQFYIHSGGQSRQAITESN